MKSFKERVYFSRSKDENWDIEEIAVEQEFKNPRDVLYLGYEVEMEVEVREDNKHKVLTIQGVDVSDKDIHI